MEVCNSESAEVEILQKCACARKIGDISAMDHPIDFMFGSIVGFSGSADRMAIFLVRSNPRWLIH